MNEDTRILSQVTLERMTSHPSSQATTTHPPVDGAFLTAASPGVVALFQVQLHMLDMLQKDVIAAQQTF